MYIVAYIGRLGRAPTPSRKPQPDVNHPNFALSLLLCVLVCTEWDLVHEDSPLYVSTLLHSSLFGQARAKSAGSTVDTQTHQLNAAISVSNASRFA